MDLLEEFFSNGKVEESSQNTSREDNREVVTISDITKEDVFNNGAYDIKQAIVFHIKTSEGVIKMAQSTLNAKGEKSGNLFYPMLWSETNQKPSRASLMFDLKEAIKEEIGAEKYEERKEKAGGLNLKFFKNCKFKAKVVGGKDKGYLFLEFGSMTTLNYWKYLVEVKGDFMDYKSIPEVAQMFKLEADEKSTDNTAAVEKAMNPDDLPF